MIPLVRLQGVYKQFGTVQALAGADFEVAAGEVHGLLGENGAGKTSLMNVLSGLYRPDAGLVEIDGVPVEVRGPQDAVRLGIGMVHQHFQLVRHFTALENVVLGREGGFRLNRRALRAQVESLMERVGLPVPLDRPVGELPVGVQQKVEILKALYRGARLLVLDEPTTLLTPQEVDALFATLRGLVKQGLGVVLITHKIREVLQVCDRITVMRRGQRVATVARAQTDPAQLVEWMVGGTPPPAVAKEPAQGDAVLLELVDVDVTDAHGTLLLRGCTLQVRAGEMVGVAGVSGNGQTALAGVVAGALAPSRGQIRIGGVPASSHGVGPRIRQGVLWIPEDRVREGLLPRMTVAENVVLGRHRALFPVLRYDPNRVRKLGESAVEAFRVICPGPDAPAGLLSGGNIQKLLAARVFTHAQTGGIRLLVAQNPTRGLDVSATEFLHTQLVQFCRKGGGVLLLSEDLDELQKLSDRIVVLYRGRVVAEFSRAEFSPYTIGRAMVGMGGAG